MRFWQFILEATDPYEILGVSPTDDLSTIKKAYRKLAMLYHPDRGGEEAKFKEVQNAWDMIQLQKRNGQSSFKPRNKQETPPWQTDPRSTYDVVGKDHRNLNFNMKYIYEKALEAEGGDKTKLKRMTIWAFDGSFARGVFTVFGSDKVYPEMAEAMRIWNSHGGNPYQTEAILVSESNGLRIIWIKGKDVNIPIEHESFNANPFNDNAFVRRLKAILSQSS